MSNYTIITDSCCDMFPETLQDWGVPCVDLSFRFDDSERDYTNRDMPIEQFYQKMRDGSVAKTSAANAEDFNTIFAAELEQGNDILYLAFSSGLSATYNSSRLAADALREQYPDRKIITIDTLAASAGQGLYVYMVVEKKKSGATLEEAAAYAEEIRPNISHWFTVDDLVYLKRGGRISAATALVGGLLSIKPVLHVDDEGHLISMTKARGRKLSLKTLADKYGEFAAEPGAGPVFISHGDCMDDVKLLEEMLASRYQVKVDQIVNVGPVIGAHSGPGTMALFFIGKER